MYSFNQQVNEETRVSLRELYAREQISVIRQMNDEEYSPCIYQNESFEQYDYHEPNHFNFGHWESPQESYIDEPFYEDPTHLIPQPIPQYQAHQFHLGSNTNPNLENSLEYYLEELNKQNERLAELEEESKLMFQTTSKRLEAKIELGIPRQEEPTHSMEHTYEDSLLLSSTTPNQAKCREEILEPSEEGPIDYMTLMVNPLFECLEVEEMNPLPLEQPCPPSFQKLENPVEEQLELESIELPKAQTFGDFVDEYLCTVPSLLSNESWLEFMEQGSSRSKERYSAKGVPPTLGAPCGRHHHGMQGAQVLNYGIKMDGRAFQWDLKVD